jgi:isocitrate/isopropylmalate dehydrogenase
MAGFAARLEEAVLDTIKSGISTRDLGGSADTDTFLTAVRSRL